VITLFTARRAGQSGRHGSTVGQYVCADLQCSKRIRTDIPPWLRSRDPVQVVAELAEDLLRRVEAFAGLVVAER